MSFRSSRSVAMRRLLVACALLVTLVLGALSPAAGAEEPMPDPEPKPPGTGRIVGGTTAPDGAWPSQVGLLYRSDPDNFRAQFCGGTVINRSWILTAAHCVEDFAASQIDILTSTQSLTSGGTRYPAVEIRVLPGFEAHTYHRDVAVIRIDRPTVAPVQPFLDQGVAVEGGTAAVATGWGTVEYESSTYPIQLQQVTVPVLTDSQCRTTAPSGYPAYGSSYMSSSMLCAGQLGKDTCQGDSGGPLVVGNGGIWTQVGITSWGSDCGAGWPGVYSKVSAFSNWVKQQIRYGPFSDANAYVDQLYRDLYDRPPTGQELLSGVFALDNGTASSTFAEQRVQGDIYQRQTGGVTRLYSALFLRNPDTSGMTYWWGQVNGGRSLPRIANIMAASSEFQNRYGTLSNGAYVDLVYQNVLGRPPDASGRAFWVNELNTGHRTRGEVMVGFSESSEYRRANKARVDVIISYFGLLRRIPTEGELAAWEGQPNLNLLRTLLGSFPYANRF